MSAEKVVIGNAELWHGDCRDVLPLLGKADALITDPPYGLGEVNGTTSKQRNRNAYASDFEDSEEYLLEVVIPALKQFLLLTSGRGLVTPGAKCMHLYPRPKTVGGFYQPAAVGMTPWGFAAYNPVLFYGDDPRRGKGQSSIMTTLTQKASCEDHPCSKPIKAMNWMLVKGTLKGETVIDPFMGSGTTGVACADHGRNFIGIELCREYFDIACERIDRAQQQGKLF